MKKSRLGFALLAGLLTFSALSLTNKKNSVLSVDASSIDINDYTQCNNAHNSHNATALLSALRTITSPGKSGSYDGLYETYKSAYLKPNGKIFDYYSSFTNYDPDKDRAGSYKKEGDCFNREHSIPQSWWGGGTSNQGSDPFIVVPTDGYVNNARSNNPFGFVANADKTFSNSKSGSADSSWGYSGTVFEPDDSVKGDFARIYYYAIAKYKNASGWSGGNAKSCFSGSDSTNCGLTPYAVKLFSYWSELDPVSEWEMSVNNAIAPIQGNRNPFIDHPEYANTLWGNVSGYTQYTHGIPSADGVTISKDEVFLISNNSTTISATSSDSSTITWSTSNSGIVSLSSTSSASNQSITLTAHAAGTATVTASATIDDETYTKSCEVEVAATKQVTSIAISNQKVKYKVNDTFVKPTVTATYNDGATAEVTNEATFTGYDLSTAGDYTVTASYSYGGATKTATYAISVKESGGGESGEAITLDISFTNNKSSDTDSLGNVWDTDGDFTKGSSYLRLNSSSTFISNSPALKVDTEKTMTVKATLRTYGGASSQSLRITAYNEDNVAISNTVVLSPASSSLAQYSGELTFDDITNHDVIIKAYSGNDKSLGISGMEFDYTTWIDSPKVLTEIDISEEPRTGYFVGNYFDPDGLVITRIYDDDSTDTYAYEDHETEFSFNPSLSTPLTADDEDVEVIYGGYSCFLAIEVIIPKELTAITIEGYQTSFTEGDPFVFGGTVTAHYHDLSTEDVTSDATFTGYDTSVTGLQTVIVSYGDATNTYDISVAAGTLSSISVSEMTTVYVKGALFAFDGVLTAIFENGYQKSVIPDSVSSPDMSTPGTKEVTITYSYNNKTVSTSYNITVNAYRDVYEVVESVVGTVTYTSGSEVVSTSSLSTSKSGYTTIESAPDSSNKALRLGSGSNRGTLTITSNTSSIYKVVVSARNYSNDSSVPVTIGGSSYSLTATYADYTKEYVAATNSVAIATTTNGRRAWIRSVTIYTKSEQNIGQTEDCIGLETFINTYMHMDYTENLGYCKDSEHHYYSSAKAAFNLLNDHQRSLFTGNAAYKAEWDRLEQWAYFNGDELNENTDTLEAGRFTINQDFPSDSNMIIIITSIAGLSVVLLGTLLVLKKRKKIR